MVLLDSFIVQKVEIFLSPADLWEVLLRKYVLNSYAWTTTKYNLFYMVNSWNVSESDVPFNFCPSFSLSSLVLRKNSKCNIVTDKIMCDYNSTNNNDQFLAETQHTCFRSVTQSLLNVLINGNKERYWSLALSQSFN